MIAAQRYQFLDKETNVPVSDFLLSKSNDILNAPHNYLMDIEGDVSSVIDSVMEKDIKAETSVLDEAKGFVRNAKDGLSSLQNTAAMAVKDLDNLTKNLFASFPLAKTAFSLIGPDCKNLILSALGANSGQRTSVGFNGRNQYSGKSPCGLDSFVKLVGAVSGDYSPIVSDLAAAQKTITGITDRGFQIGLPGVFTAMSGITNDVNTVARAGADLAARAGMSGNMNGVLEIANSSVGGMIKSINPNIASTVLQNFKIPPEVKERTLADYHIEFSTGMDKLDPDWSTYQDDDTFQGIPIQSIRNLPVANEQITNLFIAGTTKSETDMTAWDKPEPSPLALQLAALRVSNANEGGTVAKDPDTTAQYGPGISYRDNRIRWEDKPIEQSSPTSSSDNNKRNLWDGAPINQPAIVVENKTTTSQESSAPSLGYSVKHPIFKWDNDEPALNFATTK